MDKQRNQFSTENKNKHLALNVPEELGIYVEYEKAKLRKEEKYRSRGSQQFEFQIAYKECVKTISDENIGDNRAQAISFKLFEIEARYSAILQTLDVSIAVAPLYKGYYRLAKSLNRFILSESNKDRDAYTVNVLGYTSESAVPDTLDAFSSAQTLAEKALIARRIVEKARREVESVRDHFDYKKENFGRGSPPVFSTLYAVLALAELFDEFSTTGTKAVVNANATPVGDKGYNNIRYTGPFLEFVIAFFRKANISAWGPFPHHGFYDAVRKIAKKRKFDPTLHQLLDGEVDAEKMLEFMDRAKALKP